MESQIWRVRTEKIGTLESFRSEYDMESFLMNNPAIVGCWDPDADFAIPTLIRQQIHTKKGEGGSGRIDLAGIIKNDNGYELCIFELKANRIDETAVTQLHDYLKGWGKKESASKMIKDWILDLQLVGVDSSNVNKMISKPQGVLVGPEFDVKAIIKAKGMNFQGIRLTRFRAEIGQDYYVIVEDQVGDVIKRAKRAQFGWSDLIDNNLIAETDKITLTVPNKSVKFIAKPDLTAASFKSKKIIFEKASANKILKKERQIRVAHSEFKYPAKWIDSVIQSIQEGNSVLITHATGIIYFAFGWPTSFWVPGQYWIHEKSKLTLGKLDQKLV